MNALEEMRGETPESLLISPWYRCDQSAAVAELMRLSSYHTALEKLQCLLRTSNCIRRAMEVREHLKTTVTTST